MDGIEIGQKVKIAKLEVDKEYLEDLNDAVIRPEQWIDMEGVVVDFWEGEVYPINVEVTFTLTLSARFKEDELEVIDE